MIVVPTVCPMLFPSSAAIVLIAAAVQEPRPTRAFSQLNSRCPGRGRGSPQPASPSVIAGSRRAIARSSACTSKQRQGRTLLQYIQFGGIDEEEDDDEEGRKRRRLTDDDTCDEQTASLSSSAAAQVIPLVGPIPNQPPLLISGEMMLSPPTPMQWRALQEAVVVHRNSLARGKEKKDGSDSTSVGYSDGGTIDAAPLVAVIDETSGPA